MSRGSIGVATSDNLVDWIKAGELRNTGAAEARGFTAPGAIVLGGTVHLFYQTYGNGRRDAICHAWSDDGLPFTRDSTNPIFRPAGEWTVGRAIDADVIPHEQPHQSTLSVQNRQLFDEVLLHDLRSA